MLKSATTKLMCNTAADHTRLAHQQDRPTVVAATAHTRTIGNGVWFQKGAISANYHGIIVTKSSGKTSPTNVAKLCREERIRVVAEAAGLAPDEVPLLALFLEPIVRASVRIEHRYRAQIKACDEAFKTTAQTMLDILRFLYRPFITCTCLLLIPYAVFVPDRFLMTRTMLCIWAVILWIYGRVV
ncbi:MAG: hypothetical protein L6R38_005477 [Xanthoria sp. 2 TBL-2021]|nr:MAG: hypothetical protein L6R38_005477 [Xanthoria sp. 2 TBL-2021]